MLNRIRERLKEFDVKMSKDPCNRSDGHICWELEWYSPNNEDCIWYIDGDTEQEFADNLNCYCADFDVDSHVVDIIIGTVNNGSYGIYVRDLLEDAEAIEDKLVEISEEICSMVSRYEKVKYFEIEFDNIPRNEDNWDGDCVGDYSICILAERKPTFEEAKEFCKEDMKRTGYKYVVNILEISPEEAEAFFDMKSELSFPIFK